MIPHDLPDGGHNDKVIKSRSTSNTWSKGQRKGCLVIDPSRTPGCGNHNLSNLHHSGGMTYKSQIKNRRGQDTIRISKCNDLFKELNNQDQRKRKEFKT